MTDDPAPITRGGQARPDMGAITVIDNPTPVIEPAKHGLTSEPSR
ncbi:hypothetical protein [Acrocarpospora phusangensis]|nr:hypothetical protein [Acrocarpospora phusangensis]